MDRRSAPDTGVSMTTLRIGPADLHVSIDGEGDHVVLLMHSLCTTADAWAPLIERCGDRFRFVSYDLRGHGRSSAPPAPYTIADLAGDAVGLLDALGIARADVVGLSIGGRVGMYLGAHHPDRVERLVLACASTHVAPEGAAAWAERIQTVRTRGAAALITANIERWYGPLLSNYALTQLDALGAMIAATSADGFAGCAAALMGYDARPDLARITAETLVIAGTHDPGATPQDGLAIVNAVPDAALTVLQDAGHQACLQQPDAFASAVREFLGRPPRDLRGG